MAVRQRELKEVAAESKYSITELTEVDKVIETSMRNQLVDHFESSRLSGGYDYWLAEMPDGVWIARNLGELAADVKKEGYDIETEKLVFAGKAHLEWFQSITDQTIAIPGGIARSYSDPVFYPIFVEYPEMWRDGEHHIFQRFKELVSRYELTPAEALDYWAVYRRDTEAKEWANLRGVGAEAVRKNVRGAHEKLDDEELGAAYPEEVIRVVDLETVPEGEPYDDENDVFYIPTREAAEGALDSDLE